MPARSVVAADKPTLPRWQEAGLFMAVVPSRWPPSSATIDGAGGDQDGGSPSAANALFPVMRPVVMAASAQRQMPVERSEEHTSELQSLRRSSNSVFSLKKKYTTRHN